jgi:hypothetical protein
MDGALRVQAERVRDLDVAALGRAPGAPCHCRYRRGTEHLRARMEEQQKKKELSTLHVLADVFGRLFLEPIKLIRI